MWGSAESCRLDGVCPLTQSQITVTVQVRNNEILNQGKDNKIKKKKKMDSIHNKKGKTTEPKSEACTE